MRRRTKQKVRRLEDQLKISNLTINYERHRRLRAERELRELTCKMVPFNQMVEISIREIALNGSVVLTDAVKQAANRLAAQILKEGCLSISPGLQNPFTKTVTYTISLAIFKP